MYSLTTHNLRRYTANPLDYVSKSREPSDESGYFGSGKQSTLDAIFRRQASRKSADCSDTWILRSYQLDVLQ